MEEEKQAFVLLEKIDDFRIYMWEVLAAFPKYEKFCLTKDIKEVINSIDRYVLRARLSYNRKRYLYEADMELQYLKRLIRFAHKKKNPYIRSTKKYEVIMRLLAEIGSLLGGFIKSEKAKQ